MRKPRSRIKKSRGITLAEIIISMFLMGVFMVVSANLVTRSASLVRHQDERDRMLANVGTALDTVTSEIEEALEVERPGEDGQSLHELRLQRYNPEDVSEEIDRRRPLTVRYEVESGTLYRRVQSSDKSVSYPVAHGIADFTVRREHEKLYSVTVTFEEAMRDSTLDGKACMKSRI
jgi:hypothetical protein